MSRALLQWPSSPYARVAQARPARAARAAGWRCRESPRAVGWPGTGKPGVLAPPLLHWRFLDGEDPRRAAAPRGARSSGWGPTRFGQVRGTEVAARPP